MKAREPEEPSVFTTDMKPSEVQDRAQLVETPWGRLALIFDGGKPDARGNKGTFVAIDAWCPHLDGPLWEGTAHGGEIACPWHRWRYSLTTGKCTWAPA
ncbi:MAG: Rieske (2Fe-2S) protein, partial [Planctomycetota bacterium]